MKNKKSMAKILLVAFFVIAAGLVTKLPVAHANTEVYVSNLSTAVTASYDSTSKTLSLGGTMTTGREQYDTEAVCSGSTPQTWVLQYAPLDPGGLSYAITNSAGTTVMSGTGGSFYAPEGDGSTLTTFGTVCAGTSRAAPVEGDNVFDITTITPLNVSSLAAGTYTITLTTSQSYVCSFDDTTLPCAAPPNSIGSAQFTIAGAPAITVTVTPPSASVQTNNTQQFSASVTGTSNTAVTWAVNGTDGGNATVGTISSNGLYTAPASVPSPATVTVTATSQANNTSSGSATVTVTAGSPPLGGTIVVNSVNSVNGGSVPNGSWDFSGPVDPCTGSSCTGSSKTYANQPTGNYILTPGTAAGFTMRNMEIAPVAMHTSFFDNLFAFTKNLFTPEAFAVTTAPCSTNFCSLTLGSGATVTFTIQWDPLAAMTVSPSSLNFTATTLSNTATVTNTGSSGSTLTWKASSGAAWATVSPNVGSGPLSAGGAGAPVTITVNPTGLASGATTNITFTGTPSPVGAPITKTVTVTYGGSGGSGTVNSVSVSCPSPINTNATSQCVPTVAVSGGASQAVTWTVSGGGTINASGLYTAPSTATTATVKATSVQDPTKSGTATIVVTAPIVCPGSAGCPVCTLNATPQQVVIPGNTTLTYSCQDVTSCSDITGTDGEDLKTAKVSGTTLNGSASGTPTENTTYSLTCSGSAGGGSNTNASVDVSVQNPGIIECGPGQPGCQ